MTQAQLKEILKSNILNIAVADPSDPENIHDQLLAGASIFLAPPCLLCDEEDEENLDAISDIIEDKAFIAGQIKAPLASLENAPEAEFDAYYKTVLKQGEFLDNMGVSMIFLTDFEDTLTAKCAILALKEACNLPLCLGMKSTLEDGSISKALSILITAQALGVSAVGASGMYIDDALDLLSELQAFSTVPLFSISNPGEYLEPEEYRDYVSSFVNQKCAMLGLNHKRASFTSAAAKEAWQLMPLAPDFPLLNAVCSKNEHLFLDFAGKVVSRHKQMIEIKTEKEDELKKAIELFNRDGAAPVCFNIRDIELLTYALMHYAGRAAVKSDEYGEITAKEYGALVLKS